MPIVEMFCVVCEEGFEVLTSNRELSEMECPDCGSMSKKIPSVTNWDIKGTSYRNGPPTSNNNKKPKGGLICES